LGKHDKTLTAEIKRMIDNPFETDGVFQHKRLTDPTYAGKHEVTSNELTRIGALCFIPHRLPHHERSAERFKNEYEALYGSVSPAVDPAREPVQSSPTAHDNGMAARIDRSHSLRAAMAILDKSELDLILTAVCMGIPSRELVSKDKNGRGDWRQAQQRNQRVLLALSRLSRHWGYSSGEKAA
jgi:hypothetical protein